MQIHDFPRRPRGFTAQINVVITARTSALFLQERRHRSAILSSGVRHLFKHILEGFLASPVVLDGGVRFILQVLFQVQPLLQCFV